MTSSIGIDIGGTKVSAGIVDQNGLQPDTLLIERTPAAEGPHEVLRVLRHMIQKLDSLDRNLEAIGVGTAGVVSSDGSIFSSTSAISRWEGFAVGTALSEVASRPVAVLNDVHAASFGEASLGAGRSVASFLMVTVGTGVGGALFRGGVPEFGATGTAGSIGHSAARGQSPRPCGCGQEGHIEAYASGPAMELRYFELAQRRLSLRDIVALARGGGNQVADSVAQDILHEGATVLGAGLADAMNVLDTNMVILGGGVSSIEGFLEMVADTFMASALPGPSTARILPAQLGTEATLVGAGLWATRSSDARHD